jgi:hypothetical protein
MVRAFDIVPSQDGNEPVVTTNKPEPAKFGDRAGTGKGGERYGYIIALPAGRLP